MKTFQSIVLCLVVTFFINPAVSSYGAEEICLTKKESQLWRYVPEEEGIKEACFIPLPFVPEEYLCGEDIIVLPAKATISVISKALTRKIEETVVVDGTKYAAKVFAKTLPNKASRLGDPFHHIPKQLEQTILKTKPEIRKGGYKMYKMAGKVNNPKTSELYDGVFEVGVNNRGVIDHMVFRPAQR